MVSQLFRRGGAQMGREEGGGENATPREHLAPSKPCGALSKPAVGSLPWLLALHPSPPPLPGPEPSPESALGFLLGSDPFLLKKGRVSIKTPGSPPPFSGARTTHLPKRTESVRLCVLSHPGKPDLSPEAQFSHPQPLPQQRCRNQVPVAEGGSPRNENPPQDGGRTRDLGAPPEA